MDVLMLIVAGVLCLTYLHRCGQQKRPLKAMVINSLAGLTVLVAAAAVTGFMGCGIAVNRVTVLVSSVLGVPGVVMILLTVLVI